jgi:hypothetical protein
VAEEATDKSPTSSQPATRKRITTSAPDIGARQDMDWAAVLRADLVRRGSRQGSLRSRSLRVDRHSVLVARADEACS